MIVTMVVPYFSHHLDEDGDDDDAEGIHLVVAAVDRLLGLLDHTESFPETSNFQI